jgi:O-succinylbenzoic acid--CoA ligase
VEIQVRRDDDAVAAAGEPGRLFVRGPTVMRGYLGEPPLAGRWFETGDIGALDAGGTLEVFSRRTDLIVTGGENVYPLEVERAIAELPGVRDALVFPLPDPVWGQLVAAAIVLAPSDGRSAPDDDALAAWFERRLARHKRPRQVCTPNALPVLPSGKLDRAGAAAQFAALVRPVGGARRGGAPT